jgi:hypothetical protein
VTWRDSSGAASAWPAIQKSESSMLAMIRKAPAQIDKVSISIPKKSS